MCAPLSHIIVNLTNEIHDENHYLCLKSYPLYNYEIETMVHLFYYCLG